jgi:hypothetical protein
VVCTLALLGAIQNNSTSFYSQNIVYQWSHRPLNQIIAILFSTSFFIVLRPPSSFHCPLLFLAARPTLCSPRLQSEPFFPFWAACPLIIFFFLDRFPAPPTTLYLARSFDNCSIPSSGSAAHRRPVSASHQIPQRVCLER